MSQRPRFDPSCTSLLAKHLSDEVWLALSGTADAAGFTFEQAIASGLAHSDSQVGVYAGSADSYRAFAALLDPIVADYHGGQTHRVGTGRVPALGAAAQAAVRSTRIRVARNLAGYSLGPHISRDERREVEAKVVDALQSLPGELAGTYRPLSAMGAGTRRALVDGHRLFKEGDRFMESAGFNRDWPGGRGFFENADRTVLVWVNEEDHLRIISMAPGGDVQAVADRLRRIVEHLEARLDFQYDDRLGYISSCPTNLGTGMRASVHVRLPNLAAAQRDAIADREYVQVRGVHGEHTRSVDHYHDISNRRRLGFTDSELVSDMVRGVQSLVDADQQA